MAFKTLSRNQQKFSIKGTPGTLRCNEKNHPFRIDFSMPISIVLKLVKSIKFTCKECGHEVVFSKEHLRTVFPLYTKLYVVYSKLTKQYMCCGPQSFRLDYEYKRLNDKQIDEIALLIKERRLPSDVELRLPEREVAIVNLEWNVDNHTHILKAELIDYSTKELLFTGTVGQILGVVNDPARRYKWVRSIT